MKRALSACSTKHNFRIQYSRVQHRHHNNQRHHQHHYPHNHHNTTSLQRTNKVVLSRRSVATNNSYAFVKRPYSRVDVHYHYPCIDGSFAAASAYLYFKANPTLCSVVQYLTYETNKNRKFQSDKVTLVSVYPPIAEHCFLLDISCEESFLRRLTNRSHSVTWLDHHKTSFSLRDKMESEGSVPGNLEYRLEQEKSGATLSYAYFTEKNGEPLIRNPEKRKKFEELLRFVEAGDLWLQLPDAQNFAAGLRWSRLNLLITKDPVSVCEQLIAMDTEKLIALGKVYRSTEIALIDENLAKSFPVEVPAFGRCLAGYLDNKLLKSEFGHKLAEKSKAAGHRGVACVVTMEKARPGEPILFYNVSLRSTEGEDTTVLSERYGGGGHAAASAFSLPISEFEEWKRAAQRPTS